MSKRNRTPVRLGRSRSEVVTAVVVGATIVVLTGIIVWLLRPGSPGVAGGGGLAVRQPRATLLLVLVAFAGVLVVLRFRRRPLKRFGPRGSIALGLGVVALAGVVAAILWPGGLLRDYTVTPFTPPPTPPSSTPSSGPVSSVPATPTSATATTAPSGSSGG